jgi:nickel-dependent lactate racemase
MTYGEKITKYGQDICNAFDIYHHDALDDDNLSYLGKSALDVPVYINRLAVEADFLIGVGLVEIHPWAGFAGGPKIICPGIAGKKTINCTHALPATESGVVIGETRGNLVYCVHKSRSRISGMSDLLLKRLRSVS